MLRVGLTGGIGSGKSTVAQRLSTLGAVVVDADRLARDIVSPGTEGLAEVAARFGDSVIGEDGTLDRAALAALVFTDEQARRDLEAITHPRIARRTAELLAAAPDDAVVVHDVPLLVEKEYGPDYHLVVVVAADDETRVRRLHASRAMGEEEARSRIAAQATEDQRRAAADVWLDNTGTEADLGAAVDRLWRDRLVPYEHNVRNGIRVRRDEHLRLVPHDPTWPAQADRLLARLCRTLGDHVLTADHVGSTAVPGLVAKDVVDLQLGVRSLDELDDRAVRDAMQASGFPFVGRLDDNAKDGGAWPKLFYGSSDPGRVAHVHVREVGSPGWRWALAFRDWLRADGAAMREYAAEKERLAAAGLTTSEYTAAKEPWFESVHERVTAWARRSGWEPRA